MFCENCGAQLTEDARFCGKCGTKVADMTELMQPPHVEEVPIKASPAMPVTRKKKISKPAIIAGIAVAVIIALAAAFVAVGGVVDRVNVMKQLELGNRYLDGMEYEKAIAAFEAVITIDPKKEDAYIGLADAYVGLGDYESAIETLQEGIRKTGSDILQDYLEEVQKSGETGLDEVKQDETETKPQEMQDLSSYTAASEDGDWEFANESIFLINNKMSFEEIRETTEGKYWNHIVNGNNTYADFLQDSNNNTYAYCFSTKKCTNHGVACPQNGTMDCNAYNGKVQCKGFAFMLASILYDENPDVWNGIDDINDIKAGDILEYKDGETDPAWGHTVFVIGVNGPEITIAEANYENSCMVKWGRVLYKKDITVIKIHSAPKNLTEVIKKEYNENAGSEIIIKTLLPGSYHIVSSEDDCPYRIVSTNGCIASYIAYNIENTFYQVVYNENINSEFMGSFGTSGIDVTIEEGQMEIISLSNDTQEIKCELFVSDLDHPAVFGKTLKVGDSLIIENEYYNGNRHSNSVIVHGKAIISDNKVRTTRTDYWWNRYMGKEIEETSFEQSITSFYTYCESCNIIEYTVLEGEVKIFVKYDDKDKLIFYPE